MQHLAVSVEVCMSVVRCIWLQTLKVDLTMVSCSSYSAFSSQCGGVYECSEVHMAADIGGGLEHGELQLICSVDSKL